MCFCRKKIMLYSCHYVIKKKLLSPCFYKKHGEHAWSCMQDCIRQKDKTDIRPLCLSAGSGLDARESDKFTTIHAAKFQMLLPSSQLF